METRSKRHKASVILDDETQHLRNGSNDMLTTGSQSSLIHTSACRNESTE